MSTQDALGQTFSILGTLSIIAGLIGFGIATARMVVKAVPPSRLYWWAYVSTLSNIVLIVLLTQTLHP